MCSINPLNFVTHGPKRSLGIGANTAIFTIMDQLMRLLGSTLGRGRPGSLPVFGLKTPQTQLDETLLAERFVRMKIARL